MATVVNMEFQTCLEVVLGVDKLVLDNKCFVPDPIQLKDQCIVVGHAWAMCIKPWSCRPTS